MTNSPKSSNAAPAPHLDELVTEAMSGNRHSFHQLMDHYQGGIYRMVYYRVRSRMDAEDLAQDIFLQAFNNLSKLKTPDRFKSWLYRIAVNRVRDFHRKQNFRSFFGMVSMDDDDWEHREAAVAPLAEKEALRRDFWKQVQQLLTRLSKKEREVFLLRFFDQLSIKEISDTLEKGESTVKTNLYRAIKKFKAFGAPLCQYEEGLLK